jgi:uncharacterized membrane protein YhaH (DUF805 family)
MHAMFRPSPAAQAPWPDDPGAPRFVYLNPRGRLSRRAFWLHGVLALGGLTLLGRALLEIAHVRTELAESVTSLLLLWPAVAISAKRWHDRDRSAWWVLVALIPVVGWIWMLLDNGFVPGTDGPNRYGAAPTD